MLLTRHYPRVELSERLTTSHPSLRCTLHRPRHSNRDTGSCKWHAAPATAVLYLPSTAASASHSGTEQETYTEQLPASSDDDNRKRLRASVSVSDSVESALDSADAMYSVPLHQHKQQRQQRQRQLLRRSSPAHLQLPDSESVAKLCPLLAAAILLPAILLLVVPQQMLQLVAVTGSGPVLEAPTAAAEAVSSCFAQLVGLTWAFNAMLSLVVQVRLYV